MHQPLDSNVKFIRMTTGEDIISEVIDKDEKEKYVLINPLKVVYLLGERPGSLMLSLIEWIFPRICTEQKFEIFSSDIITIGDPSDDIVDYYYDAVGRVDTSDFKLDTDHESVAKMRQQMENEKRKESINEVSNDEMELYNQVLESLQTNKRKLH